MFFCRTWRQVDISVKKGEMLVIVGKTGAEGGRKSEKTYGFMMFHVSYPMTDPYVLYIWCAMDPINIPPILCYSYSINYYQHHGSVMGSSFLIRIRI